MDLLLDALSEALSLLVSFDAQVMAAAWRSVWISSLAVLLAMVIGLPLGTVLARRTFFGKRCLVILFRAGMAVPTVFIGVVCYALLSRRGPLGPTELLYSPWAIVMGEVLLALPIIVALSHGAIKSLDPRVAETSFTLGAGRLRRWWIYLCEARVGVVLAVLTAFGRCVTELGIAMMVGGNLKDHTRTLATATALETSKGEFALGIAMGLVLLVIALGITALVVWFTGESED